MPLGEQVLIPGTKLLRVGGAGGGCFTPDVGQARLEDSVGHLGDRIGRAKTMLLTILIQKEIVAGLTAGGVKA